MVETPWAAKLDPKLFSYLRLYNSVPAFLAAVTQDAFDRTTLSGTVVASLAAFGAGSSGGGAGAGASANSSSS